MWKANIQTKSIELIKRLYANKKKMPKANDRHYKRWKQSKIYIYKNTTIFIWSIELDNFIRAIEYIYVGIHSNRLTWDVINKNAWESIKIIKSFRKIKSFDFQTKDKRISPANKRNTLDFRSISSLEELNRISNNNSSTAWDTYFIGNVYTHLVCTEICIIFVRNSKTKQNNQAKVLSVRLLYKHANSFFNLFGKLPNLVYNNYLFFGLSWSLDGEPFFHPYIYCSIRFHNHNLVGQYQIEIDINNIQNSKQFTTLYWELRFW